ncbi:BatA domain-containing protein [Aequorivita echinoideorum]|uniref:BatA domain-containing protein n=1 Tax=Aequorivita echinoideorum TaxID=1549647 RepID=A0ABS5S6U9_9FLAO|nr:BatA domain-containing protein [Aequorivita echinoideorum]MBT0608931.1 BatA domain-containing protein [Aequorivita echinoideorum]
MQFKHPEILYALFLLLIPIFIHLFQLRRFQKVEFTNVAFLKKVTIQTRKSSQLKKWLTLLARMLALACVIIAFAQPFSASKTALSTNKETVIYIDNSFSMQAKGSDGPMLQRAAQNLFENITAEKLSWFSNNSERKNVSVQDFKNEILGLEYSQNQLTPSQILLKADQFFSKENDVQRQLLLISDFQVKETFPEIPENMNVNVVQLKPVNPSNIAIDSVYIASKNSANVQLTVRISANGEDLKQTPISLFNGEKLVAKTAVDFSEKNSNTIDFEIENTEGFNGRIELTEPNIPFDNTLFFNINKPKKIKVLAINEADGNYLQRLFNTEEFDFVQQPFRNLNYNEIPDQNFIILNELTEIPAPLATALKAFSEGGGSVLIIPSGQAEVGNYNSVLSLLDLGTLENLLPQEKRITKIMFSHPLFENVFEKQVVNFQYPTVNSFYNVASNASAALTYEDGKPFLLQSGKNYFFTSPINTENSNFQNSPLVVPTIYNMSQLSLALPDLYYEIGSQNTFAVPVKLGSDEILTLKTETENFIPLQQTKANQVLITTTDEPNAAGIYEIFSKEEFLENVSYNYDRSESNLNYLNAEDWQGAKTFSSVESLFENIAEQNSINSFWKWFAIFALLFLILEMLILKFHK